MTAHAVKQASDTAVGRFIDRQTDQRSATDNYIKFSERPSCTLQEAIHATGLSRTTLYEKIASGELLSKTVGRRRLINVPSLLALVGADAETATTAGENPQNACR